MWCVINISMSIHWNFQVVCVWFDWDYYYDAHPDVVQANMDMATHWKEFGFYQGRAGSFQFDPVFYWNTPPTCCRLTARLVSAMRFITGLQ